MGRRVMAFDEGSHYYWRNGDSCRELPLKTDPSRTRKTTIKDARKLGLVPSVTTVLKAKNSPALASLKQRKVVMMIWQCAL